MDAPGTVTPQAEAPAKKQRTPAQMEATAKMLAAMAERRKADWEKKKANVVEDTKKQLDTLQSRRARTAPEEAPLPSRTPELPIDLLVSLRNQIKEELKSELAPKPRRARAPPSLRNGISRVETHGASAPELQRISRTPEQAPPSMSRALAGPELLEKLFFKY